MTKGQMANDWPLKVALILVTIILTSLGQSFVTALRSDALQEMNERIFRIEVSVEQIARDVGDLKAIHAGRE
jgi:hypothetical protein